MRATEEDIEAFVAEQWPAFLTDAQRLISIDSSLDAERGTRCAFRFGASCGA